MFTGDFKMYVRKSNRQKINVNDIKGNGTQTLI